MQWRVRALCEPWLATSCESRQMKPGHRASPDCAARRSRSDTEPPSRHSITMAVELLMRVVPKKRLGTRHDTRGATAHAQWAMYRMRTRHDTHEGVQRVKSTQRQDSKHEGVATADAQRRAWMVGSQVGMVRGVCVPPRRGGAPDARVPRGYL